MTRTIPPGRIRSNRLSQRVIAALEGITAASWRWRHNRVPAGNWRHHQLTGGAPEPLGYQSEMEAPCRRVPGLEDYGCVLETVAPGEAIEPARPLRCTKP